MTKAHAWPALWTLLLHMSQQMGSVHHVLHGVAPVLNVGGLLNSLALPAGETEKSTRNCPG